MKTQKNNKEKENTILNKKIDFLFVYPPSCYPVSPFMSAPILSSILKSNGYRTKCIDFNAKYFNEKIFNKKYLEERYKYINEKINLIKENKYKFTSDTEKYIIESNLKKIVFLLKNRNDLLRKIINNIESSVRILKSNIDFYDINKAGFAIDIVQDAQEFILNTFFLSVQMNTNIGNKFTTINAVIENPNLNPYLEYFKEKIDSGFFENINYIMISQPFNMQTLASFTLAFLLKKHTNVKVCIGGNYINRIKDSLIKNNIIFEKYFDYILTGLGEESITDFALYTQGKLTPENVAGLIYRDKNEIKANKPQTFLNNIEKRTNISFEGINFKDYIVPEVIIPIQVSKGCPWGKCTFCVFHEGKTKYQITKAEQIVKEIEYLNKTYNITKFEFVDECLPPQYYYEIANEIIKKGLNIQYYGFARVENGFTTEILDKMYESGFRLFEWGYETPSKRIIEIYNKGINSEGREDVLKRTDMSGIWNHCLTIIDVPFQTIEEELYDINYYKKNQNLIHSRQLSIFGLYKNATIAQNPDEYNMTNIKDKGDLAISLKYERKDKEEDNKNLSIKKAEQELLNEYKNKAWRVLLKMVDEYLFLYTTKYKKEELLSLKRTDNI